MKIKVTTGEGVVTFSESIEAIDSDVITTSSFSEVLEAEEESLAAEEATSATTEVSATSQTTSTTAATAVTSTDLTSVVTATEGTLEAIFEEAAYIYGVDVELLKAIAKQESNFDSTATSSAGAQGIMQLMPSTAESLGCEDAYDPYDNIMAGASYIAQMLERYDGDVELALAAYNAGPGNVDKYGGIPPFTETQNYVTKVMAYYEEGVTIPDSANILTSTEEDENTEAQSAYDILSKLNQVIQDRLAYLQS